MSGIAFHCFRGCVSTRSDGVSADQFPFSDRLLYMCYLSVLPNTLTFRIPPVGALRRKEGVCTFSLSLPHLSLHVNKMLSTKDH